MIKSWMWPFDFPAFCQWEEEDLMCSKEAVCLSYLVYLLINHFVLSMTFSKLSNAYRHSHPILFFLELQFPIFQIHFLKHFITSLPSIPVHNRSKRSQLHYYLGQGQTGSQGCGPYCWLAFGWEFTSRIPFSLCFL